MPASQQSDGFSEDQITGSGPEILDYLRFLQDSATSHREYLESLYTTTLGVVAVAVVLISALIGWLGWRSLRDARDAAQRFFEDELRKLIDVRTRAIDERVEAMLKRLETREAQVNTSIANLSSYLIQSADGGDNDEEVEPKSQLQIIKERARILWVDDFPGNNTSPMEILTAAGHRIETVLNTETAMDRLQSLQYDLVISDMGRADDPSAGITLLREMKQAEIKTPVIIYASQGAIERYGNAARKLGAVATVNGPTQLLAAVRRSLSY